MRLRKTNQAGQPGRHLPLGNLNLNLLISACPQGQWAGLACQSARRKGSYPLPRNARDICTWARQFFSKTAAVVKLCGSFESSGLDASSKIFGLVQPPSTLEDRGPRLRLLTGLAPIFEEPQLV